MDGNRFDDLSRLLGAGLSRRTAVRGAVAAVAASLGLRSAADAQVTQADCGNRTCANRPEVCNAGCVCCTYTNSRGKVTNSRCRPPGTCAPGATICPAGQIPDSVQGCVLDACPPFQSRFMNTCVDPCDPDPCTGEAEGCFARPDGTFFCGGNSSTSCVPCTSDAECTAGFENQCLLNSCEEVTGGFCTNVSTS